MRPRNSVCVLLACLTWPAATASAWLGPEHEAQGLSAFYYGLAFVPAAERARLAPYAAGGSASTVAHGSAAPDHCHSFWHSTVPDRVGAACAEGPQCDIRGGVPHDFWGGSNFNRWRYVLGTNENHFGEHTETHWRFWHELALEAARRHRLTGAPQCERLAMGIESFALHYVEDRTAAGHGFTQSASGFAQGMAGEAAKDNRRGCLHGQDWGTRTTLGCAQTGLGAVGRAFGDAFWPASGVGDWTSDDGWLSRPPAQFFETTRRGAGRALGEVMAALTCGAPPAEPIAPTFVSNLEMCRVVLGECCRGQSGPAATCDRCENGENGAGAADPQNRHLSHGEVIEACPFDRVLDDAPTAADPGEWIAITEDRNVWVRLALPAGTESTTTVARTLWRAPGGPEPVHPDARFATTAAILDLAGCRDGLGLGAPLRDDTCGEWPCDRRPVIFCTGTRAPDACATDPCARWYHHTALDATGRCACPNVHGDGLCALERGETFRDGAGDCGPAYCGDGYCDAAATEDVTTCPHDCAAVVCGDAFCHPEETAAACPADCGPPAAFDDDAFQCGDAGIERAALSPTCGDGLLERGESCQTCPGDGATGPAYLGNEACTDASATYPSTGFTSHACTTPPCLETSRGGWCTGFCDPDEGCVPPSLGAPVDCAAVTGASPERDRARCGLLACHDFPLSIVPVAGGANFRMGLADYAVPIVVRFPEPMEDQAVDAHVLQVDPLGGPLIALAGGQDNDGGVFVRPIGSNGWHAGTAGANTELHFAIPGNGPTMMSQWIFGMVRASGGVTAERFVLRIARTATGGPALRRADGSPIGAGTLDVPFSASMGSGPGSCTPGSSCAADWRWCCSTMSCEIAQGCSVPGAFELGGCACCAGPNPFMPLACDLCYSWTLEDLFSTYCPGG